jgi:mono/diheme cytochrome c family protein
LARSDRRFGAVRGHARCASRVAPRHRFFAVAAALALATGCTEIDQTLARVPAFAFMHDVPSLGPYQNPLPAPPGAVPFESPLGEVFAPMGGTEAELQAFAAGRHGLNPYAHDDPVVLEIGRIMYDRHCAVCHGVTGLGDGPVVGPGRFPLAPSIVEGPALGQSDGYMYAIIRAGRGLMPSYGGRIAHHERWAIVNYMRALQAAGGAPAAAPAQPAPEPPADTLPAAAAPAAPTGPGAAALDPGTGQESR